MRRKKVQSYDEQDYRDYYVQENESESYEDFPEETIVLPKKHSFLRSQLLTVIQILLCVLVLGFALITKAIGGTFYATIATWYFEHYNNSVFTGTADPITFFQENIHLPETSRLSADSPAHGDFVLPLKAGTLTSPYGERNYNGSQQFHKGMDIAAEQDSEIAAVWNGTVIVAEQEPSYGNYIILQHDDGYTTLYAHCNKLLVQKGDIVKAGNVIALVGQTGDADGCHLHLEIKKEDKNLDPAAFIGEAYT